MRTVVRIQFVHDTGQECVAELRSDSELHGQVGKPDEFYAHVASETYAALHDLSHHVHAPIRPEDAAATVPGWNGAGSSVEAARG